jgi:hypothetical protein
MRRRTEHLRGSWVAGVAFAAVVFALGFGGCGAKATGGGSGFGPDPVNPGNGKADASGDDSSAAWTGDSSLVSLALDGDMAPDRAPPPAACKLPGLWCYQTAAPCVTELTGTVFDPAGQVPLSNVVVYVPADPTIKLTPITQGTNSCSACTTQIANYMALAVTDVNGHFTMKGVPATTSVPVVVQIGKWRREITIAPTKALTKCVANTVADGTLRLPRSRAEGDLPQMAVLTGGADDLGCFLRGMGLDAAEYAAPPASGASTGRLDVYQGVGGPGLSTGTAGACTGTGCPLWASKAALEHYDIVLLACEGQEHGETKPNAALGFMHDWLNEGGKVFATHYQYYWFQNANAPADFRGVANWLGSSGGFLFGNYTVDTSFQRGMVFDQWLTGPGVGAATGTSIALTGVANSVSTVSADATRWIYDPNTMNTKYMSFLTPVGGLKATVDGGAETTTYCGKAVFSDLHTSGQPSASVPAPCPTTLTAQQKALEYLFFDLAACVAPENAPPPMPPPNPPPPPPPPR